MSRLFQMFRTLLDAMRIRQPLLRIMTCPSEKELLGMAANTYLFDRGWYASRDQKESIDANHAPVPWMTYPFVDFITPLLSRDFHLFEFGSGSSTAFFSKRVKDVTAVESDLDWFNHVNRNKPDNVRVIYRPLDQADGYVRSCVAEGKKFEIVAVDGRNRVECIRHSIDCIADDGVVILDNSDREEYRPAYDFLAEHGFRYIEFWGMVPIVSNTCCTTLFYRTRNCLNI